MGKVKTEPEVDLLLTDLYGKYNVPIDQPKIDLIKKTYGSDYRTLLTDFYGKYAPEVVLDETKLTSIEGTYGLKKKEQTSQNFFRSDGETPSTLQTDLLPFQGQKVTALPQQQAPYKGGAMIDGRWKVNAPANLNTESGDFIKPEVPAIDFEKKVQEELANIAESGDFIKPEVKNPVADTNRQTFAEQGKGYTEDKEKKLDEYFQMQAAGDAEKYQKLKELRKNYTQSQEYTALSEYNFQKGGQLKFDLANLEYRKREQEAAGDVEGMQQTAALQQQTASDYNKVVAEQSELMKEYPEVYEKYIQQGNVNRMYKMMKKEGGLTKALAVSVHAAERVTNVATHTTADLLKLGNKLAPGTYTGGSAAFDDFVDKAVNEMIIMTPQTKIYDAKTGKVDGAEIIPFVAEQLAVMSTLIRGAGLLGGGANGIVKAAFITQLEPTRAALRAMEPTLSEAEIMLYAVPVTLGQAYLERIMPDNHLVFGSPQMMKQFVKDLAQGGNVAVKSLQQQFKNVISENIETFSQNTFQNVANVATNATLGTSLETAQSTEDNVNDFLITSGVAFLAGANQIKLGNSKVFSALATQPELTEMEIQAQVEIGALKPERAEEIRAEVKKYAEAIKKIPAEVPAEKRETVIPMVVESETLKEESQADVIDVVKKVTLEKKAQVDQAIREEIYGGSPEEVQEFAEKKSEGEALTTPADKQFEANNKTRIDSALAKLQKLKISEKDETGKENNKTSEKAAEKTEKPSSPVEPTLQSATDESKPSPDIRTVNSGVEGEKESKKADLDNTIFVTPPGEDNNFRDEIPLGESEEIDKAEYVDLGNNVVAFVTDRVAYIIDKNYTNRNGKYITEKVYRKSGSNEFSKVSKPNLEIVSKANKWDLDERYNRLKNVPDLLHEKTNTPVTNKEVDAKGEITENTYIPKYYDKAKKYTDLKEGDIIEIPIHDLMPRIGGELGMADANSKTNSPIEVNVLDSGILQINNGHNRFKKALINGEQTVKIKVVKTEGKADIYPDWMNRLKDRAIKENRVKEVTQETKTTPAAIIEKGEKVKEPAAVPVKETVKPKIKKDEKVNQKGRKERLLTEKQAAPSKTEVAVPVNTESSEITHAKAEISNKILEWDSDRFTPRIELGLAWTDIRKGKSDIEKGNYETAPAKKLIAAINSAKAEGHYRYVVGSGSMIQATNVPIGTVPEHDSYELTPDEEKYRDEHIEELAKQYDLWIEGLSEDEYNNELKNIQDEKENSIDRQGESHTNDAPTQSGSVNSEQEQLDSANRKAKELGFNHAEHLLNSVNRRVKTFKGYKGEVYTKVSEVPEDVLARVVKERSNEPTVREKVQPILDALEKLKSKKGNAYESILGIPVAFVDTTIEIIQGAIKGGATIADAIQKGVEFLKEQKVKFDQKKFEATLRDALADEIAGEVPPKSEAPPSEPDSEEPNTRKKSVLNRAYEGTTTDQVKDAISKHGLNYPVESHIEAKANAIALIEEIGAENALQAVRRSEIEDGAAAYVWSEIIDSVGYELATATDPAEIARLEELEAQLVSEFDKKARSGGRFNSAIGDIYANSNFGFKAAANIEKYKATNKTGEIPAEIEQKFRDLEKRYKELEIKTKEAEERAKRAEDELAVANIAESIAREKKAAAKPPRLASLSPTEQKRRVELKNKYFGTFNDISRMLTLLAEKDFREYVGLLFKEAKEDFKYFARQIVKEVGAGIKKHINQLWTDSGGVLPDYESSGEIVKGILRIPHAVIRRYVESGITDPDELTSAIHEELVKEYPKLTIRQVRDAISNYGKTVNTNQEEIEQQIRKIKRVDKIISALEDIAAKKRPLKSGQQRDKLEADERRQNKALREALKGLPLDAAEAEQQLKTSLDIIKTRLKNQIEDLQREIDTGEKRAKTEGVPYDDKVRELIAQRDAKKAERDAIFGDKELSDSQKLDRAIKAIDRAIVENERRIAEHDLETKKGKGVTSPELEAKKERLKKTKEELKELQKEAGIPEKRRLETAKATAKRGIQQLQERLKNKDFSKKKSTPIIADSELLRLRAEKILIGEEYAKEHYKNELKNRALHTKILDGLSEAWGLTRVLMATGEFSFILIQGGVYTISHPKNALKSLSKMFSHFASAKKAETWMRHIHAQEFYPRMKASKLALTQQDAKLTAREEQFIGGWVHHIWNIIGMPLKLIPGKHKIFTPIDWFKAAITGNAIDPVSAFERWKAINPLQAFERAGTSFLNSMRVLRYLQGEQMLAQQGKTFEGNPQDFKDMADVINTFTGRASLGKAELIAKPLAVVFFSPRNWASILKQTILLPFYFPSLHTKGEKFYKPSVAQKMALADYMKFVAVTASVLALIKAGSDDDDDSPTISTDPTSSDFLVVKIGNTRIDPWGGRKQMVVFLARQITDSITRGNGDKVQLGTGFRPTTRGDLLLQMVQNKLAPSSSLAWKYAFSLVDKKGQRTDKFGEPLNLVSASTDNLMPIYWGTVKELHKDQPETVAAFIDALAFMGMGSQTYEPKQKKTVKPAEQTFK